ncbi:MAG: methyltransferase type 11, partial [Cyanobacteria bacterium P01_H01_bin.121]
RLLGWLNDIFEEPHIREYAQGSIDAWLHSAGFQAVATTNCWGLNQVSRGQKAIATTQPSTVQPEQSPWPEPSYAL